MEWISWIVSCGLVDLRPLIIQRTQSSKMRRRPQSLKYNFFDLWNVFRRSFPNFARIHSPLSTRVKKTQGKDLESFEENELWTLDSLKEKLISPPLLSFPKQNGDYTSNTHIRDKQTGRVVLQDKSDCKTARPIGYLSRTVTKHGKIWIAHNANILQ